MSEFTVPDDRSAETETSRHSIIPRNVRTLIRSEEAALALLAAIIGALAGLCVAGMVSVIQWVHHILFAVEGHEVSGAEFVEPMRAFFVPALGGILVGLLAFIQVGS